MQIAQDQNSLLRHTQHARPPVMFNARLLICLVAASVAIAAPALSGNGTLSTSTLSLSSAVPSVTGSSISSAPPEEETVSAASDFLNDQAYSQGTTETPEAINGGLGASLIFPDNIALDQQNPDVLAPPTTDQGIV